MVQTCADVDYVVLRERQRERKKRRDYDSSQKRYFHMYKVLMVVSFIYR